MSKPLSLADLRKGYDRLRQRYFMDAPPPLHVPPAAKELQWGWLPENTDAVGETFFDEDGDPFLLRLKRRYNDRWTLARPTLLHELTHMRLGPAYSCGAWREFNHRWQYAPVIPKTSKWHEETLRLVQLGALQL